MENEYQRGIILKALDEDGAIIGSVRAFCENETVYIGKLMVYPSKQGQGVGTQLLLEVEKQYPKQRYELFTSTRSKKNIALYQKLGYKIFDKKQVTEELRFVYIEMWITDYCHEMENHRKILEFLRGAALRPYLDRLNEEEQKLFMDEVLKNLEVEYSYQANGKILFPFKRLFLIGQK